MIILTQKKKKKKHKTVTEVCATDSFLSLAILKNKRMGGKVHCVVNNLCVATCGGVGDEVGTFHYFLFFCVSVLHASLTINGSKVTVCLWLNVNDGETKRKNHQNTTKEISESDVRSIQNIGTLSYINSVLDDGHVV